MWGQEWSKAHGVKSTSLECDFREVGGQRLEGKRCLSVMSLVLSGLCEVTQNCGAGNGVQAMECNLPLLRVLSGKLAAGPSVMFLGLTGLHQSRVSCGEGNEEQGMGYITCRWRCSQEN